MAFAGSPSRRHCIKTSTSLLTERFEDAFLLLFPSCTRERDRVIALSGRKVKDEKDREPFATFHDGRKFEKKEAKDRRRTKRFTFDSSKVLVHPGSRDRHLEAIAVREDGEWKVKMSNRVCTICTPANRRCPTIMAGSRGGVFFLFLLSLPPFEIDTFGHVEKRGSARTVCLPSQENIVEGTRW